MVAEFPNSGPAVLAFKRDALTSITNLTPDAIDLPPYEEMLLSSVPLDDGRLPGDATAWIR